MTVSVVVPNVGMGVTEVTIIKWLKAVGDTVESGEMLVEVETAKSTVEIEAPASGTLAAILCHPDDEVEVGVEIATIEE